MSPSFTIEYMPWCHFSNLSNMPPSRRHIVASGSGQDILQDMAGIFSLFALSGTSPIQIKAAPDGPRAESFSSVSGPSKLLTYINPLEKNGALAKRP